MERMFQVLADFLDANPATLKGHSHVYRLDLNEALGSLGDGTIQVISDSTAKPLENMLLLVDSAQLLDSRLTEPQTRNALRAAMRSIGESVLVVMLYWHPDPANVDRTGVLSIVKDVNTIVARPYSAEETRRTIFKSFAPKWYEESRCICYKNAFDSLLALEPWITVGNGKEALPYLAIFLGKMVTKGLREDYEQCQASPTIESLYISYADQAADKIKELKGQFPAELQRRIDPIVRETLSDLGTMKSKPHEFTSDGHLIIRRGHITARLLGGTIYNVDSHAALSNEPPKITPWPSDLWAVPTTSTKSLRESANGQVPRG
jgi:hypothetical protein